MVKKVLVQMLTPQWEEDKDKSYSDIKVQLDELTRQLKKGQRQVAILAIDKNFDIDSNYEFQCSVKFVFTQNFIIVILYKDFMYFTIFEDLTIRWLKLKPETRHYIAGHLFGYGESEIREFIRTWCKI